MKYIDKDYGRILIGQNAKENWDIIDGSEPDDLWFHLSNYPSCHIVARLKKMIDNSELVYIANLVKENTTKYKNKNNLKICYCNISDIKKNKSKIGSVIISNQKYIDI